MLVTGIYAAVLALLYVQLALGVIKQRRAHRSPWVIAALMGLLHPYSEPYRHITMLANTSLADSFLSTNKYHPYLFI